MSHNEVIESARLAYALSKDPGNGRDIEVWWTLRDSAKAEFDAALAYRDAKVKAEALRDAADEFRNCPDWGYRASRPMATEDYLRARANEIEPTA